MPKVQNPVSTGSAVKKTTASKSKDKKFEKSDKEIDLTSSKGKKGTPQDEIDAKERIPKIVPKKPIYPYFMFNMEKGKEFADEQRAKNQPVDIKGNAKKVSELWKEMTEAQKEKYVKKSADDKARYEAETKQLQEKGYFVNKDGVKSTDILPELKNFDKETTVFPKQVGTTMFFFFQDKDKEIREKHKDLNFGDMAKKRVELFHALTDKQKKPYEAQVEKDRIRYDREVHELKTKGFFVNSDGVRSIDIRKKKTRAQLTKEKEAKAKDKEDAKKQKEKELAKKEESKQKEQDDALAMNTAWAFFYNQNFEKVFHDQKGKTESAKKKNADKVIKDMWLEMTDTARKRLITRARKAAEKDAQVEPEEVQEKPKKRKSPSVAKDAKTAANPTANKKQKK